MPNSYRPSNLGGIAGSGIYARPSQPDYSSAIDSVVNAFQSNRNAVIARTVMQQRADAARAQVAREDAALKVSQGHLDLAQQEAANRLIAAGHDEVAPILANYRPRFFAVTSTHRDKRQWD